MQTKFASAEGTEEGAEGFLSWRNEVPAGREAAGKPRVDHPTITRLLIHMFCGMKIHIRMS